MIWNNDATVKRIDANVSAILAMVKQIAAKEAQMAVDLTAVTAEVAKNTSVTGSVVALLQQLTALIKAIPPSSDPATQAALDQLTATLTANDGTLATAVTANTPAS